MAIFRATIGRIVQTPEMYPVPGQTALPIKKPAREGRLNPLLVSLEH